MSNRSHPFSKGSVPIFGELLKVLSFLTQFQGNSNSSMSFSSHSRTRAFSSSRPKTHAVWVMKDPKTELFVLCFNSFYLKLDFLAWFLICFWNHAFMHLHVVFMLYSCLLVFVYLFSVFVLFVFQKLKNEKNTKTVCVCVYWYLCTLDGHWNKIL